MSMLQIRRRECHQSSLAEPSTAHQTYQPVSCFVPALLFFSFSSISNNCLASADMTRNLISEYDQIRFDMKTFLFVRDKVKS